MHPGITYDVQKAIIEERLRKAELAQRCQLDHDVRRPRGATARRARRHRWRGVVGLIAAIRGLPMREPWLRR